jgi:nitroreductase
MPPHAGAGNPLGVDLSPPPREAAGGRAQHEEEKMAERRSDHPVNPLFLSRWSPRAFDGSEMPEADLLTLFEAARWAPSAFNSQPWRFLYARRGEADWERFLDLLIPWNRSWAQGASVLIYVLSDRLPFTDKAGEPAASHTHSYDAGAAWACLALQATRLGYQAHGMSGVDFERARAELAVPDRYRIEAAAVVGRLGDPANLPEKLRAREMPSGRKPVEEFAFSGGWPA